MGRCFNLKVGTDGQLVFVLGNAVQDASAAVNLYLGPGEIGQHDFEGTEVLLV